MQMHLYVLGANIVHAFDDTVEKSGELCMGGRCGVVPLMEQTSTTGNRRYHMSPVQLWKNALLLSLMAREIHQSPKNKFINKIHLCVNHYEKNIHFQKFKYSKHIS